MVANRNWQTVGGGYPQASEVFVTDNMFGAGVAAVFVIGDPNGVVSGTMGQLAVDRDTGDVYQNTDDDTTWTPFGGGGGVTGSGTIDRVAKFTETGSVIGDSTVRDDVNGVWTPSVFRVTTDPTEPSELNFVAIKANPAYAELSPYMLRYQRTVTQGSPDTSPTVAFHSEVIAVDCVGSVQNQENLVTGTVDCTELDRATYAGEFRSICTRSSETGVLENIAILSNASGGDTNYSFRSAQGTLRNDDEASLAQCLVVRPLTGTALTKPLRMQQVLGVYPAVDLGSDVESFFVSRAQDPLTQHCAVGIGTPQYIAGVQLAIKNTLAGVTTTGVQLGLDTDVAAGARGGFVMSKGAAGDFTGNTAGMWVGTGPLTGATGKALSIFTDMGEAMLFGNGAPYDWCMRINPGNEITLGQTAAHKLGVLGAAPIVQQTLPAIPTTAEIRALLVAFGFAAA